MCSKSSNSGYRRQIEDAIGCGGWAVLASWVGHGFCRQNSLRTLWEPGFGSNWYEEGEGEVPKWNFFFFWVIKEEI